MSPNYWFWGHGAGTGTGAILGEVFNEDGAVWSRIENTSLYLVLENGSPRVVPEPGTLGLLALGVAACAVRRRRRA